MVELKDMERVFDRTYEELSREFWQARSYLAAHLAVMRFLGWKDADYGVLACASGFGTSFVYDHRNTWVSWVAPKGCDERIARATGFRMEWVKTDSPAQAWEILRAQLDQGVPVRISWMEESVIAGYRDGGGEKDRAVLVLCVPFASPGKWWTWDQFVEWHQGPTSGHGMLRPFAGRMDKVPEKESAAEALSTLVGLARRDPRAADTLYQPCRFGLDGIESFADDVAKTGPGGHDESYFDNGWRGCHTIYPQWTCRQLTARYLRESAGLFGAGCREHLLEAAGEYESAHRAWLEWEAQLGNERHAPKGAWNDEGRRKRGALAIRAARDHEERGVAAVEKALASLS